MTDAAIGRDKTYLPDISVLWSKNTDIFEIVENYIAGLQQQREVSGEEIRLIKRRISKLSNLLGFPFTALVLHADIDEEAVSDVFVRINSKGTPLNQADFILTLMSVFWDEGRKDLESFCRDARIPKKDEPSPFNYFIYPYPDQLLRVSVGVAFKRARLKYVYSILRGKDLETETFSEDRRIQQFEVLKNAQSRVLNLTYWHDFMNCVRQAGFRSSKMISSQNNLLFSYILYLIGRTEYNAPEFELRRTIARWFFMSAVTGRFTGSPESDMEFDLARLREVKTASDFLKALNRVCEITLTNDFWAVTLPNDLATSSPKSPSLFAYHAALVLLDARALFSTTKVANLLDPSLQSHKSAVERHHLFPKSYLKRLGISSIRETNQIANYALVEWGDNLQIADQAPSEYLPKLKNRFTAPERERMYILHALPENWQNMEYDEFLERRRELMAEVISKGYATLKAIDHVDEKEDTGFELAKEILNGESEAVEFKSTLRINLHTGNKDPKIELSALKTMAGFLNGSGGTLIIGVADDGSPVGIEHDGFPNEDKMSLHLINIIKSRLGIPALTNINANFDDYEDTRILVVKCHKSPTAVFVQDGDIQRFYVRTGPATTELNTSQTIEYVKYRFSIK